MQQSIFNHYKQATKTSLEQANCLPFAVYHDKSVYTKELSCTFHNDWIFVCPKAQLASPGDFYAIDIGGEQIVIVHGENGELSALSNICRHRGTPLLDLGFGQIDKHIVCPYHAWTYSDQGEFKGAPLTGDIHIEAKLHCLAKFETSCWNALVFVNLSDNPQPFNQRIEGLDKYLELFNLQRFEHSYSSAAQQWNCNWKLAVENGIESYHLFKVHKETLEPLTPSKQTYYVAGSSQWALTGGAMRNQRGKLMKWLTGTYPEAYDHYLLLFLPPSFIAVISYDGIDWINVLPIDAENCLVTSGGLSQKKIKNFSSAQFQLTSAFLKEDKEICERVQKGMYSQKARGGKLVSLEKILVDFHQYLANRLFNCQSDVFIESKDAGIFLSQRE